MTKSGLIEDVARKTPHISKRDTEVVVNTIFDSMVEALKRGDRIEIRGFGSFQVKVREARDGRNPKTGEPVHISAKRTPFFKVGKELKRYSAEEQRKRKQRIRQIAQRERSEHWHRTEGARPGTADHSLFVGGSKSVAELRQRSHDKLGEVRAACCCPAAVRSCSSCCSCCSCF